MERPAETPAVGDFDPDVRQAGVVEDAEPERALGRVLDAELRDDDQRPCAPCPRQV